GLEKKNRLINEKEREIIAYHEAGHAIVAERVETADPVHKISIIPRGVGALGYMQQLPDERHLLQHDELLDRLAVLLGGRAAEALAFGQVSTGAANDLERATGLAHRMVCEFGMSQRLGPVTYAGADAPFPGIAQPDAGRARSETTAREIDREVRALVSGAFDRARRILERDRRALDGVARRLLSDEMMDRDALLAILDVVPAA
ncbi:MAG TPA: cell division protein FtsH, partial [Longimicrobiales bacterium]